MNLTANQKKFVGKMLLLGHFLMPHIWSLRTPKFHYEIERDALDPDIPLLNIISPRGSAKTMLIAVLRVVYHIFLEKGKNGKKVVVIVSRTQGHAINILQTIKDVLDFNQKFRVLFGYWGNQSAKKWSNHEIVLKDNTVITCKGMGQQLRGLNYDGVRPTLIVLDDPEDENNTKTPEAMNDNLIWLLQSAVPSMDATIQTKLIVIGTPLHQLCIVIKLKEMTNWKTLHFSYYVEDEAGNISSLWPEMKSVEELEKERKALAKIGRQSVFYKERLCEVIGDEEQLFNEEDIHFYDGYVRLNDEDEAFLYVTEIDGKKLDSVKIVPINIFTGVDPASSVRRSADRSVIFNLGVDHTMSRWCLPYWAKRARPLEVGEAIIANYKRFKANKTRIESVGYQEMLRQYVESKQYIPGITIKENPRNAKSNRIESLQPIVADGKLYVMKNMRDFIDEMLMYPRGSHDDFLDAFFFANKGCYRPYHEVTIQTVDSLKELESTTIKPGVAHLVA